MSTHKAFPGDDTSRSSRHRRGVRENPLPVPQASKMSIRARNDGLRSIGVLLHQQPAAGSSGIKVTLTAMSTIGSIGGGRIASEHKTIGRLVRVEDVVP